jgi:hypothetical protein
MIMIKIKNPNRPATEQIVENQNLCYQLAEAGFNLALVVPEPASRPDGTANEEAERP